MALYASGLTLVSPVDQIGTDVLESFTWTPPDGTIADPPTFWYDVQLQISDDNLSWADSFWSHLTPWSAGDHYLHWFVGDPSPKPQYYRVKTLFSYAPPAYSNSVYAQITHTGDPTKTPATNLRANCT